ncbi:hypothetical protein JOD54_002461 [Actinokineospora baliensis]|uniref:hypothetical protein n=1 Tax=Actinokineospora baliensis TaxID=547056 RepID=UPI0019566031|nr:hypothetical protein [Actinokineospora baliensis]MBM7772257.1 hypothetical protein [Actinokineospora baliensis]
MRGVLAAASDRLLALIVPKVEAQAMACHEEHSYCKGDCPFWWWRRAHYMVCDDGSSHWEYECCGCGC